MDDIFSEMLSALQKNDKLRDTAIQLIKTVPIPAKATEEKERDEIFRNIMLELVTGKIKSLEDAYRTVEGRLPRSSSKYADNSRVFSSDWAKRHVNTQLSRFYNEALLRSLS